MNEYFDAMSALLKRNIYCALSRMLSDCDKKRKPFDWDRYISLMDSYWAAITFAASSLERCDENVNCLMDNLLTHHCESLLVSTLLIDCIALYRNSKGFVDRKMFIVKHLIRCNSVREKSGIYYQCMEINAVHFNLALKRGDSKLVRLLMKYGVNVLALDQKSEKKFIISTLWRFNCQNQVLGVDDVRELYTKAAVFASKIWAKSCYYSIALPFNSRDHTRLMQLLLVVKAILIKQSGNGMHQEYVECIRMYFRNITWPFISSDEIRFILGKMMCKDVESFCRDCNELFPEFQRILWAPRSLKELCRAEVRQILYGNEQRTTTLPAAVSALCIPNTLKNYLLGEE